MKTLTIKPDGWPCKLGECPPGHFVFEDSLCFKTEYGELEVYNEAGEAFWGGQSTKLAVSNLIVQPVVAEWVDEEQ